MDRDKKLSQLTEKLGVISGKIAECHTRISDIDLAMAEPAENDDFSLLIRRNDSLLDEKENLQREIRKLQTLIPSLSRRKSQIEAEKLAERNKADIEDWNALQAEIKELCQRHEAKVNEANEVRQEIISRVRREWFNIPREKNMAGGGWRRPAHVAKSALIDDNFPHEAGTFNYLK